MRTTIGLLAVLATLAAAAFAAGPATAAAGYVSCSGGYNPDGSPGSFYRSIKAKRVSCHAARVLVKAWVVKQASSDGANPATKVAVKGFTCRGRSVGGSADVDGGLAVTCKRAGGKKVVKFYGHP